MLSYSLLNDVEIRGKREKHKKILSDETRKQISSNSDLFCYARESVMKKRDEDILWM